MATAVKPKPKAKGRTTPTIRHASSLATANGKAAAAAKATAPAPTTGAAGHIRVTSDEKLILDKTITPAETLKFARQFPGWFAKLKPGPCAITIYCDIAKPAKKTAAKKSGSKV
jgi:hypothetical protein